MPDLDSLIREVLSMVQEEQKKKNFGNNAYAASAAEAGQYAKDARDEYNKMYEPPGSTTALDRAAKLKGIEMTNTGAIDLEKTKSAGELARLGLANESAANVANINLEGKKYEIDQGLAARKYEVDVGNKGNDSFSTLMSKAIESDPSILSDPKKLAETAQNIRGMLPPGKSDIQNFNRVDAAAPTSEKTAAIPSSISPSINPSANKKILPTLSVMDIDRQMTEEANNERIFGNKYANWAAKRLRNIGNAVPRAIGASAYKGSQILDDISNWKGWDK